MFKNLMRSDSEEKEKELEGDNYFFILICNNIQNGLLCL